LNESFISRMTKQLAKTESLLRAGTFFGGEVWLLDVDC
jgi:hypothetical protein